MTALGANLVAISPQIADNSLTTVEKNELTFTVLSDTGNTVARQFGLVHVLSEDLRPLYTQFGADLPTFNGNDTFELPFPGTFIIGTDGAIKLSYVNADYKQRLEPAKILKVLEGMG